jgi:hypothetical protein
MNTTELILTAITYVAVPMSIVFTIMAWSPDVEE